VFDFTNRASSAVIGAAEAALDEVLAGVADPEQ
jgi:hypothetical protein